MVRLSDFLADLTEVSPEIASKLVGSLFQQTGSLVIGGAVFVILGLLGFGGTGSLWYLGGALLSGSICAWRVWQNRAYALSRERAAPVVWARRSLAAAWTMSAGWGAWSVALVYEPDKTLVAGVIATLGSCATGAAIRSSGVPIIASGQIVLALGPMILACLVSGNIYMTFYAATISLHVVAALGLNRHLHKQTLRLLLQDEDKTALVRSLEFAKQELEVVNRHLAKLSATDALTGVANRRAFDLTAAREWRRLERDQAPLSLLLIDVDYFKKFNDLYGHPAGDNCLRQVAAAIGSETQRGGDFLARYGGEEFVVLLPGCYADAAERVAEGMLAAVAGRGLAHEASPFNIVTISIGMGSMIPNRESTVEQLTDLADMALYEAKRSGRNRVHASAVPALARSQPDAPAGGSAGGQAQHAPA